MQICYKNYLIKLVDDRGYTPNSTDNSINYSKEYGAFNDKAFSISSKTGIRISDYSEEIASAIVCETDGSTTLHQHSAIVKNDKLFICCGSKIYAFSLPYLRLHWCVKADMATCLGIHEFNENLIVHGELAISCIDNHGVCKWEFTGRDIFVQPGHDPGVQIINNLIHVWDWDGNKYVLNNNGELHQ